MSSRKRTNKPYGGQITTTVPWLESPSPAATPQVAESSIKLDEIHLPSSQPRSYFDPQALKELVNSVRQHGILQPLLVRPRQSGGYELVAGERRYRAATEVGLTEVPVVVRELSSEQAWQLALIENLQREDLNPIEETEGVLALLALRLECDVSEVKSLLYKMKNAWDKAGQESASSSDGFRSHVFPNSDEAGETESRKNVFPNSDKAGETESSSRVAPNSDEAGETESRKNVFPNSDLEETTESRSRVAPNSDEAGETESRKNVFPNPDEAGETESRKNVFPNSDEVKFQAIQEVFASLGRIYWLSFITTRLPLLNLPEEILVALREGQLEYTKAIALARVKDEQQRQQLLSATISNNWSLSQIKEQIKQLALPSQPESPQPKSQLPDRLKVAYQKLKKTRLWEDPSKEQQIDTLLTQLEALLGND